MHKLPLLLLLVLGLTGPGSTARAQAAPAQEPPAGSSPNPGGMATPPRVEPTVAALTRRDADNVALTLRPGATLLLHGFEFNGEPVATDKIHLHELSPGVYELLSNAYASGLWHFQVADSAAYYGLGAHFDTLDHAHTIVRNLAVSVAAPRGSTTPAPVPFFSSTTGYGLWLDTAADATFDLNASDPANIIVDVSAARLRIVLFTGETDDQGQFANMHLAFQAIAPPGPTALALDFNDLPGALTALLSLRLSGYPFPPGTSVVLPASPDPVLLSRWLEFLAFTPGPSLAVPQGVPASLQALAKKYAAVHEGLAPYLANRKQILPLVLVNQNDPKTRNIADEYFLGQSLLVAPAFDQNPTRVVYLPQGDWRNVFTHETFAGGQTIVVPTPLDSIPVFARTGFNLPDLSPTAKPLEPERP